MITDIAMLAMAQALGVQLVSAQSVDLFVSKAFWANLHHGPLNDMC